MCVVDSTHVIDFEVDDDHSPRWSWAQFTPSTNTIQFLIVAVGGVSIFANSDEDVGIVDTMELNAFVESNREPHIAPSLLWLHLLQGLLEMIRILVRYRIHTTSALCRILMLCTSLMIGLVRRTY